MKTKRPRTFFFQKKKKMGVIVARKFSKTGESSRLNLFKRSDDAFVVNSLTREGFRLRLEVYNSRTIDGLSWNEINH